MLAVSTGGRGIEGFGRCTVHLHKSILLGSTRQPTEVRIHLLNSGEIKKTQTSATAKTMMVCILNRIPIFAIGKPGNSKSLALRILNSNLRGPDSEKE